MFVTKISRRDLCDAERVPAGACEKHVGACGRVYLAAVDEAVVKHGVGRRDDDAASIGDAKTKHRSLRDGAPFVVTIGSDLHGSRTAAERGYVAGTRAKNVRGTYPHLAVDGEKRKIVLVAQRSRSNGGEVGTLDPAHAHEIHVARELLVNARCRHGLRAFEHLHPGRRV